MGSYPANLERMRGHMGRSGCDPGEAGWNASRQERF